MIEKELENLKMIFASHDKKEIGERGHYDAEEAAVLQGTRQSSGLLNFTSGTVKMRMR